MSKLGNREESLIYGLDIGTRSVVGTVGYKEKDRFVVVAQVSRQHETRAMLDGQIHDIPAVGNAISEVTRELEQRISKKLESVCIAAAGRVLKTVMAQAEHDFEEEKVVTVDDILALEALAVEHAYEKFQKENDTDMRFYCVGYSVMRYFMNNYPMGNLLDHKAKSISLELIATFLPDDVVDGLYRAVEHAGLRVANMTLEPIAAIEVAIPQMFRMLNIGLIDVGAGTSDICITKDGTIVAYGMLPIAGDGLTEIIARHCLVDFDTAESIKIGIEKNEIVEYKDIMGLPKTIKKEEVLSLVEPQIDRMAGEAADKILELNGGKAVSAVFVVGGGGKIEGYTGKIAEKLGIPAERCAVRGEDVMQKIDFEEKNAVKDSLLVTPIGICLNYYQKSNNFIFVSFNNKRVRLYDNNKLTVIDAAVQASFPNDGLFPKRGASITVTVNGRQRMFRGKPGEAAVITVNGKNADIHTTIRSNDVIEVVESTAGAPAAADLGKLLENDSPISIVVNDQKIDFPKFASVNGEIQPGSYALKDGDEIETLGYYTVAQIAEFMDVVTDRDADIYVNNQLADEDTKVYDNFSVNWTLKEERPQNTEKDGEKAEKPFEEDGASGISETDADRSASVGGSENAKQAKPDHDESTKTKKSRDADGGKKEGGGDKAEEEGSIVTVFVNKDKVTLSGKKDYIFVDVFDYIDFDLSKPKGTMIVLKLNGVNAAYTDLLKNGDRLDIYWTP